jgi:hypothetical protein
MVLQQPLPAAEDPTVNTLQLVGLVDVLAGE